MDLSQYERIWEEEKCQKEFGKSRNDKKGFGWGRKCKNRYIDLEGAEMPKYNSHFSGFLEWRTSWQRHLLFGHQLVMKMMMIEEDDVDDNDDKPARVWSA